jgi:hypothetical protein
MMASGRPSLERAGSDRVQSLLTIRDRNDCIASFSSPLPGPRKDLVHDGPAARDLALIEKSEHALPPGRRDHLVLAIHWFSISPQ